MSIKSEKLKVHILRLSNSLDFNEAIKEWEWIGVSYAENWDSCPCSQDIKEVCHIKNKVNGNTTHVGNNCIKKFLDVDTGSVFRLFKKLADNPDMVIPNKLIGYASRFGYIYEGEVKFLGSLVKSKYALSEKQKAWRDKIVYRLLNRVVVS